MMRKSVMVSVAMVAFGISAASARAGVVWQGLPANCTPASSSAASVVYTDGSVGFAAGATGVIQLLCNVDLTRAPNVASMSVTSKDPDGMTMDAHIPVTLFKKSKTTGASTVVTNASSGIAFNVQSSSWTDTGIATHTVVPGPTALNYDANIYYVNATLIRLFPTQDVVLHAIQLNY